MAELATLRVDGHTVAHYVDGAELEEILAPRPHLHPVRTLAGRPVTDAVPDDHRWHLGVGVAVQDVDGHNLWGGRTYLRGQGYTWRSDHGRIRHTAFDAVGDDGFVEHLDWVGTDRLLHERRTVRARAAAAGWELELITELTNATDRPVRLGSPATNGRTGAGYGGLFWRLPPAQAPHVSAARRERTCGDRTADSITTTSFSTEIGAAVVEGEGSVHGSVARWLAWRETGPEPFTLVLTGVDNDDPWFVRVEGYPGIGSQLAAVDPVVLVPGGTVVRGWRALVADGILDQDTVAEWLCTTRGAMP
jgi:hypothetical protein